MMDETQFCADNNLAFACTFTDGVADYTVSNPSSVGLIAPGRIVGHGTTLAEALAAYMAVLVDERGAQKDYLAPYVADPAADQTVSDAVKADERMPVKVADFLGDELSPKG